MNPEKWRQIKVIFNEAIEMDSDACEDFLKKQTDSEIVNEVRKLLEAEKENNFAQPVAYLSNLWQEDSAEDFIGKEIGGYKIIREIGVGGMGIVFEAVRQTDDFSQIVALKILRKGMDSDAMLRRFRHERQILATLEHPNIAHLIDGGKTAEGVPFFALEFVKGLSIDEFCEERNLNIS
ncbi:MAG: protein kinase, partial [Acidobacteriota bacterium]